MEITLLGIEYFKIDHHYKISIVIITLEQQKFNISVHDYKNEA
jgi:hypothetical protein